jgi:hypothetical protein
MCLRHFGAGAYFADICYPAIWSKSAEIGVDFFFRDFSQFTSRTRDRCFLYVICRERNLDSLGIVRNCRVSCGYDVGSAPDPSGSNPDEFGSAGAWTNPKPAYSSDPFTAGLNHRLSSERFGAVRHQAVECFHGFLVFSQIWYVPRHFSVSGFAFAVSTSLRIRPIRLMGPIRPMRLDCSPSVPVPRKLCPLTPPPQEPLQYTAPWVGSVFRFPLVRRHGRSSRQFGRAQTRQMQRAMAIAG